MQSVYQFWTGCFFVQNILKQGENFRVIQQKTNGHEKSIDRHILKI